MVIINQETCIGCNQCVKDCPANNLFLEDKKAQVKSTCIECGHCIAVCPTNSVSIDNLKDEEILDYKNYQQANSDDLLNLLKSRRTIRNYKSTKVDNDIIKQVLQAGRFSPTAMNKQGVEYIVIQDQMAEFKDLIYEGISALAQLMKADKKYYFYSKRLQEYVKAYETDKSDDSIIFNAPVFLLVLADSKTDAALAASSIELMAHSLGLGSLISGFCERAIESYPKLKEYLEIQDKEIGLCMLLGYPNVKYQRNAPKKPLNIKWL